MALPGINHTKTPEPDILITGGRVIDPERGLDGPYDVAIAGTRIISVEPTGNPAPAARTIDASGLLVVPGLIDVHVHAAGNLRKAIGEETVLPPDLVGVHAGVTTILDAGSTGAYNVAGFLNYAASHARTRTLGMVNAGVLGIFRVPEIREPEDVDHHATVAAIRLRPDVLKGVKVRMVSPAIIEMGIDLPKAAKAMAQAADARLMVHVGDILQGHTIAASLAPRLLREVLTAGDIVTHSFSRHVGALLAGDDLIEEALEAKRNGVVFDVGVGRNNFNFDAAKKILDQGLTPDTLGSDVTAGSRITPTHSLTESMGKVMSLGLSLEKTLDMVTCAPAKALGIQKETGTLEPGRTADISLLEEIRGDWIYRDADGAANRGDVAIIPRIAIRAGELMPLDFGPRPWGWLPESAN